MKSIVNGELLNLDYVVSHMCVQERTAVVYCSSLLSVKFGRFEGFLTWKKLDIYLILLCIGTHSPRMSLH